MVDELNVKERCPTSGSVKKVVIFLHGYGADGADLFSLSEPLSEQFPHCFLPLLMPLENVEHHLLALSGFRYLI